MEGLNLDVSGSGLNKWILEVEIHTRVVWRLEYETKIRFAGSCPMGKDDEHEFLPSTNQ